MEVLVAITGRGQYFVLAVVVVTENVCYNFTLQVRRILTGLGFTMAMQDGTSTTLSGNLICSKLGAR